MGWYRLSETEFRISSNERAPTLNIALSRQAFLRGLGALGGLAIADVASAKVPLTLGRRPKAIAMWDFSWLERRWPGAGYEDWDRALDELVDRGYDAVRIDAYPHLVVAGPERQWMLKPKWEVQDWGAPTFVNVQIVPDMLVFIGKCAARGVKVGLSSWYREDTSERQLAITDGAKMGEAWLAVLRAIAAAGLLDQIFYVDLCNEWGSASTAPYAGLKLPWGDWNDPRSLTWMRTAIATVRRDFAELPLLFSFDDTNPAHYLENDLSFLDGIDQHLWMAGENDDEFYRKVGYHYEPFSEAGYHNMQMHAASAYAADPAYWRKLLTTAITQVAAAARQAGLPLMTTEAWAVVDYKDWPLLPWDWVKDLCALGTRTASATGQWLAIGTSNFCGPQFHGMWRDVAWHRDLTALIKAGPIDASARGGRLWRRL